MGGTPGCLGKSPKRGERPVTKPAGGLGGRLGKRSDLNRGNVGAEPLQDTPARWRAQLANELSGGAPGCLGKSPTRGERPKTKPTVGLEGRPGKRNDHVHGNVGVELPRDAPAKARAQLVRKPKVVRPGCPVPSARARVGRVRKNAGATGKKAQRGQARLSRSIGEGTSGTRPQQRGRNWRESPARTGQVDPLHR